MSEHLSSGDLRAYERGAAPPEKILSWDDHLAGCGQCRERLSSSDALVSWAEGLTEGSEDVGEPLPAPAAIAIAVWLATRPAASFPAQWSAADRTLVEQTLRAGTLPFAPPRADLSSKPCILLSPPAADSFHPLAPLNAMLETDRPRFLWQKLAGANYYQVEVYDGDFQPVIHGQPLADTQWTPDRPLERGKL